MKRALSLSAALLALAASAAPRARAACVTNLTANPGGLQAMINSVTTIGGGDTCINLNPGVFNEKITIASTVAFTDTASRLVLKPAAGGVVISSMNAGAAVIDVALASVTLQNITVAANGPTAMGISGTGNYLTLSNVVVIDTMSFLTAAGAKIGGPWATISNSSFTAQGPAAYGLWLTATSSGSAVSVTTAVAQGSVASLELDASSVTVNASFAQSLTSGPALAVWNANTLSISNSSFSAVGLAGYGAYLSTATGVTLSNDYFSATSDALRIVNTGSNQIANSTMAATGGFALYVNGSGNSVSASSLYSNFEGAQFAGAASNNTISGSMIVSRGATAPAVLFQNSAASNTITTSFVTSVSSGGVSFFQGPHNNTISFSTVTVSATGAAAVSVWASSMNTVDHSYLESPLGDGWSVVSANLNLLSNSTAYCNTAVTYTAVRLTGASSNTISGSYFNNPNAQSLGIGSNSNFNTVSGSTFTSALAGGGPLAIVSNSIGETITNSYIGSYGASGIGVWMATGADYAIISQSTIAVPGANGIGLYLGTSHSTFTSLAVQAPNGLGVDLIGTISGTVVRNSFIQASSGVIVQLGANDMSIVGDTITASGAGSAAVYLVSSSMNVLDHDYLEDAPGDGLRMVGSNYNLISNTTMYNNTAATFSALRTLNSSSNTITGSFILAPNGNAANLQSGSSFNTISQSTLTVTSLTAAPFSVSGSCFGNTLTQSYIGNYAPSGVGVWATVGVDYTTISQSTIVASGVNGIGLYLNASRSTFTNLAVSVPNGLGVDLIGAVTGSVLSYSLIQASTGVLLSSGVNGASIVGDTITSSGLGAAGIAFQSVSTSVISGSSITASGLKGYGISDVGGASNTITGSGVTSWQGVGVLESGGTGLSVSGTSISGSTGAVVDSSNLTQVLGSSVTGTGVAGLAITNAPAGSTTTVANTVISGSQTVTYALTVNGSSSAVLSLGGLVSVHGWANIVAGGLFSTNNTTVFGGDLTLGPGVFVSTNASAFDFYGAAEAPPVAAQTVTIGPTLSQAFGAVDVKVASFSARGSSFFATSFSDTVQGSTAAFAPGTTAPYAFASLTLRGGTGANGRVNFRSLTPNSPMSLKVSVATVTLAQVSDSNATFGSMIQANDGTSLDGNPTFSAAGSDPNWNFLPFLDVELPGETFVEGSGKIGVASAQTAGGVPVTVRAVSASSATVFSSNITVSVSASQPYDDAGTQSLQNGATVFNLVLRKAEPAGLVHVFTVASTQAYAASYVDSLALNPGPLSKLQLLLAGEATDPGSAAGKTAATPNPIVVTMASSPTIRGVDLYWNKVPSAVDLVMLSTSGANLPQTTNLTGGTTAFPVVIFTSTGSGRNLVAMDLTNGAITASTSAVFNVFSLTSASPTVSIGIANRSTQTTLGGMISGTAADPSGVIQVTVRLVRVSDQLNYDFLAGFVAPAVSSAAVLGSPNGASTSWSVAVPDAIFPTAGSSDYYVVVNSKNANNNVLTSVSTFTFNPTFGRVGSLGDGEGTATVTFLNPGSLAPSSAGCGLVTASMTFTAGPHGLNSGGQIAVHVPDLWTAPASTVAAQPAPAYAGTLVVGSTTPFSITFNPASQSGGTFGSNWFLYTANANVTPGATIFFLYTGFTGGGPRAVGPQPFIFQSRGDPTVGLFKPIASQPQPSLNPGPATTLQFSNQQPLTLGPLQTSSTMQLVVTDACGNSTNTATTVQTFLGAIVNGGVGDPGAVFYQSGGGPAISSLLIPGNASVSPGFYFETSTPGPSYEQIFSSATMPNGALSWATRYAQVLASSVSLTGVSVDTGTLMPGVSVATMTPGSFAGAAVINFTLSNPNTPWEVIISTDGTTYYPELVHRNGFGQPGRSLSWYGVTETSFPQTLVKPGGPYYVKIRAGGGVVEDRSLQIFMAPSAFVYGTVNSTGAYAYVNAQGPNTSFANFAVASSTGYFEIYGLQNGGRYNIVATTGSLLNGQFVQLQSSSYNVTASNGGTNIGAFPFPTPTFLRMRVQIPQTAPFEFWGGFNAFSTTGQQAWGTLHYLMGADKSDDGSQSFGGSASTWTIVGVTPGTYNFQINLPQVGVSSSLANVVIPPGATTDMFLALQRKANVYGWAVVPSSTQYGTWVSVQGTKAGDTRPSVYGGSYLQGYQYGVAQTSAVYSLFGLDPGSWTITARAQGFGSASTSVYISSSADIGNPVGGGLDLTMSSGSVLGGLLQLVGDSRNLPNASNGGLNVYVNAYNPATYSNGFAQVYIATSATLAQSTFSITGLDVGTYFVNTWVQGAQAPQISTTVSASGGFTTMTLPVDTARAAVTVYLPPSPAPDFHKVSLYYTAQSTVPTQIQDFGALPACGAPAVPPCLSVFVTSATWLTPVFSPGYFGVTGDYGKLGTFGSAYGQLADGQITPVVLDLRGSTFTVSGTVVVAGNVNLNINGTAVSVSSVAGVLAQSTTNEYCITGLVNPVSTLTFHLELLPITRQGNFMTWPLPNPVQRNTPNSCANPQAWGGNDVDPFLAYIVSISSADGSFVIPNVPPGAYVLRAPTNLDNIYGWGPDELPPVRKIVTVTTSNVSGLTFTISQGQSVSGLVHMPQGMLGNRGVQVSLNDASGSAIRTAFVNFNQSNSAFYTLDRVPDGAYALVVQDWGWPRAFGARPTTLKVSGAAVSQDIQLVQTGVIKGKLAVKQFLPNSTTAQFVLVDSHNAGQLPRSFQIWAEANPWFQGGRADADSGCGGAAAAAANTPACGGGGPSFDANGQFSISAVLPGLYDVHFYTRDDPNDPGSIKLVSSLAPGISVNGGATTDIGAFNLTSALTLRGQVTDVTTSSPIPNVPIRAQASLSQNHEVDVPTSVTDSSGNYTLVGLDPNTKFYDVYAGKRQDNNVPPPYELKVAPSVNVTSITVLNFALTPAPYSLSGQILGAPGGPTLQIPFNSGNGASRVGAMIFLQKSGVQPHDNPIADITAPTDPQGRFTIPSLTTGTYRLTAVSLGYASYSQSVMISSASVTLAPITLGQGATLTGALRKPDGSNPGQREVDTMVAVTNSFGQLIVATLVPDANAKTYTNYTISGFLPGLSYRVLIFPRGGNGAAMSPAEASNVVFSTTTETRTLDLVLRPTAPYVFSKAKKLGSAYKLRFELSQPLRSRQASDNDLTAVLSTFSAAGTLSQWDLDASRSILTALYSAGVNESSFTVHLRGYSTQTNPDSLDPVNPQFVYDSTYTFYAGIDGYYANVLSNFNGGTLAIDDDPGRVAIGGGSFQVDASSSVSIGLAISQESLAAAPALAAAGLAPTAANIKAMRYGGSAYPQELFRAMAATPPQVSPLSAFYNVLLPLGLRTALQKPVPLTINYSTGTDPTTLNLYWYNAAANAYVLQQDVTGAPPVIDPVNHTITINVNHFSTFVLFNTGVAVITGNAFAGDFTAYNFPNPFDLSVKTVTAIHGAGGSASVRGTQISIGLPPDVSGDGSIKIYNVAGEKVRTIALGTLQGGFYYYQPWDGRNDSGRDVASGVYIGQVKVGDHSKFFKMALIK